MGDEDRFNRIEQKLDGITQILQTLANLAKHDERMVNLALREKRSEERLDAIEKSVLKNSTISAVLQWIAATTTAGIIAFAIKQLF